MNDYIYIKAWGKFLHSFDYYIEQQVEKARRDGAPQNACFFSVDSNKWVTFDDIQNLQTKEIVAKYVEAIR
jgi:hypothetical protein